VEYTIDRAGPPPKTIHCSQATVGVVHGATGAWRETEADVKTPAVARRMDVRIGEWASLRKLEGGATPRSIVRPK
jgi:hypothetical protein